MEHGSELSTLSESPRIDTVFAADEAFEIRALFSNNRGVASEQLGPRAARRPRQVHAESIPRLVAGLELIATEFGNTERYAPRLGEPGTRRPSRRERSRSSLNASARMAP